MHLFDHGWARHFALVVSLPACAATMACACAGTPSAAPPERAATSTTPEPLRPAPTASGVPTTSGAPAAIVATAATTAAAPATVAEGPCSGARLDLDQTLRRRECERCSETETKDLATVLDARLEVSPAKVVGGQQVNVRAVLRNRTKRPLELRFVWHAGPMFTIGATDGSGKPAGEPKGPPPLKPGQSYRPGPPYLVCLTLAAGGEAFVQRPWRAVQWRWAASGAPSGPGGAPQREVAGPLPTGRYMLNMQTMLQGASPTTPELGRPSAAVEVVAGSGAARRP